MKILRKISNHELLMAQFGNVVTSAEFDGPLNLETLEQALRLEATRHPLLSAHIMQQNDDYFFQTHPHELSINIVEANVFEKTQQDIINTNFNFSKQLGAISVVTYKQHSAIHLCFSHIICDAKSSVSFLNNALEIYERILHNKPIDATALPLMQPIEAIVEKQLGVLTPLNLRKMQALFKNIDTLSPDRADILNQADCRTKTKTITFKLSPLIARVHKEKTTLNSLLCAAQLLALYNLLPDKKSAHLNIAMAIDIRNRLTKPLSDEHLFAAVDGGVFSYNIDSTLDIWQLAQQITKDAIKYIRSNDVLRALYIADLKKASDLLPHESSWEKTPLSIKTSNVGQAQITKNTSELTLTNLNFLTTNTDGYIITNIISFNDTLNITVSYTSPRYSEQQINVFCHQIQRQLKIS